MLLVLLLFLACTTHTTLAQCLTRQDNRPFKDQAVHQELLHSQLDFALSLLKAVGTQNASDNVFISPLSVYNAMLLAYFVSEGHTEVTLRKALFLPKTQDKLDMLLSYRLQKLLSTSGAYKSQVNSANRLFISVNQTVRDCITEDVFTDEIEQVDFSVRGVNHAVDRINSWVANQTKNNIQNLVSVDSINPGTQLILANAAYFKGVWKNQFDERDTRTGKFFVSKNKSVPVQMMYQLNRFSHWRSDQVGAEILQLPFKGGEISMILMLPDLSHTAHPAADLLQKLDSDTLLNIIRESMRTENEDKTEVSIPKFSVERTLELTPILESLGVGDLFQSTSDLSGLTGGPRIQLSSAIHKAKIQVDERGTEAAAATVLTDTRIPADGFLCDRPFLYLLYDNTRTSLLFAGIYNDPTK